MLVIHVHLPEPPHHRQLEILIVDGLVGATGEGEAVGDLKPRVGNQAEQRSLGDPRTRSGGLELVAVLDQLHDHQAVNLDNLKQENIYMWTSFGNVYLLQNVQNVKDWLTFTIFQQEF